MDGSKESDLIADMDFKFLRSTVRPIYEELKRPVRLVDLFAGAGGLTLGVAEACRRLGRGLDVRLALESDEKIRAVYAQNFPETKHFATGRVEDVLNGKMRCRLTAAERSAVNAVGRVDILVAGPPCQGHSHLNNHTRSDDPGNEMYMRAVRGAAVFQPDAILIENVPNILNDGRDVVGRAIGGLESLGYEVWESLVSAIEVGVPQARRRHVLIASRRKMRFAPQEDVSVALRNLKWAIGDVRASENGDEMLKPTRLSEANKRRAEWLLRHNKYDLPNHLRPNCHKSNPYHRYKAMYGRLAWNLPSPTITTGFRSPGQGRYLHPSEPRVLTCREAARVQFFPDWYDFSAAGSPTKIALAIGNAVPSKLASLIVSGGLVTR